MFRERDVVENKRLSVVMLILFAKEGVILYYNPLLKTIITLRHIQGLKI